MSAPLTEAQRENRRRLAERFGDLNGLLKIELPTEAENRAAARQLANQNLADGAGTVAPHAFARRIERRQTEIDEERRRDMAQFFRDSSNANRIVRGERAQ